MNNEIDTSRLDNIIFYDIEKAIKSYRQYAQKNIKASKINITIDQWLILKSIKDNPGLTQKEIAEMVFKDYASVTRIIEVLVKRSYLKRSFHKTDRRRYNLELTATAEKTLKKLLPIIHSNRTHALDGVSQQALKQMQKTLKKIIVNCSTK
jgi:DNA-binding MarR family transcriptional regulator